VASDGVSAAIGKQILHPGVEVNVIVWFKMCQKKLARVWQNWASINIFCLECGILLNGPLKIVFSMGTVSIHSMVAR
jgi:hypothetical protein